MEQDRLKWNKKHKDIEANPAEPSQTLQNNHHLAPGKKALDIACGLGRHSRFLSKHGYEIDAVDISDYALGRLQGTQGVTTHHVDIDHYTPPPESYHLICNFFFLERRLFGPIIKSLKSDGILIFETFAKHPEHALPSSTTAEHYLQPDELRNAFPKLHTLDYREREFTRPDGVKCLLASLVAQKKDRVSDAQHEETS